MDNRQDIREMMPEDISRVLINIGEKNFRGKQVFQWVQNKAAQGFYDVKNINKAAKIYLHENTLLEPLKCLKERISKDGTRKFLWGLNDRQAVESVLLYHSGDITRTRHTLCLSTQVGCAMGCSFCATGKLGFKRNLSAGEIVGQVLDTTFRMRKEEPDFKINNVVYMGMGEPLLNLPAVIKSIRLLNHKDGQAIGIRRISVSTCGIVPKIKELADEGLDIVLAVSLHAPDNELRDAIMPVNKKYPLEVLLPVCKYYVTKTGKRITFEYALVKGFNDDAKRAMQLARLVAGISANINIIPVNTSFQGNEKFQKPRSQVSREFVNILKEQGIQAVLREEKGSDIEAACGQLAGTYDEQSFE